MQQITSKLLSTKTLAVSSACGGGRIFANMEGAQACVGINVPQPLNFDPINHCQHVFKQTKTAQAPCSLPLAFQIFKLTCVTTIQEIMQHTTWELNLIEGMQFSSKSATWISVPKK